MFYGLVVWMTFSRMRRKNDFVFTKYQQSFPSSIHHSLELVSCTDSVFWPMRAESHKVFNIVLTKLLPHVASDKQIENA
jgi:hypothetical protein